MIARRKIIISGLSKSCFDHDFTVRPVQSDLFLPAKKARLHLSNPKPENRAFRSDRGDRVQCTSAMQRDGRVGYPVYQPFFFMSAPPPFSVGLPGTVNIGYMGLSSVLL